MGTHIHTRLAELRAEFETGQVELAKLEQQRIYLHETLLRIGGAIQVLEELLVDEPASGQNGAQPAAATVAAGATRESSFGQ